MKNLMKALGNKYFVRGEETSSIYHLANVFVSNLTLSLLDIGTSYFKQLGLNEKDALNAMKPLIKGNIESIFEKGFVNSLTGPVLRGDLSTVEKHLSAINKEDKDLYKILSLNLLKLVALRDNGNVHISSIQQEDLLNTEEKTQNLLNNSKKHLEIHRLLGGIE